MRPLDDHQMPAVGHETELGAQPSRVLEGVLERQLGVSGSPEHDHRAGDVGQILTRVVRDHRQIGQTLQAAEDVLNLLSQEGIFVDELPLAEFEPSAWRRFMSGIRGAKVGAIGGITDPHALEVAGRLLQSDAGFRDTALFFLRRFERVLAEHARDADDDALAALAATRSGRAFMILARTSGTFA